MEVGDLRPLPPAQVVLQGCKWADQEYPVERTDLGQLRSSVPLPSFLSWDHEMLLM